MTIIEAIHWYCERDEEMSDDVTIPRNSFEKLLDLAAEALWLKDVEFSNYPYEDEIELMEDMHEVAGKEMDKRLQFAIKRARILNAKEEKRCS